MTSLIKTESNLHWCGRFFNGMLLSAPIAAGTSADKPLDMISLIIFVGIMCALIIHIILRIRSKTKSNKND
jgi:hypothetical protein